MEEIAIECDSEILQEKLQQALKELIPLFRVNSEELARFTPWDLRRTLDSNEYPKHSRNAPAYSFLDNWIYFPLRNPFATPDKGNYNLFSRRVITHEIGHYIHNMLNPAIKEGNRDYVLQGKRPAGHSFLTELVADYGCFILSITGHSSDELASEEGRRIYEKRGCGFLPVLARMILKEAIDARVISLK